jgi:hypothetical protein
MRMYVLIQKVTGMIPEALPALYASPRAALGAAVVELDRLMRERGFEGRYTLYPPYRAGDTVNLTAQSDKTNGYPTEVCIDLYIQPFTVDEDLEQDFKEVGT